ncbi:DoxX family membrane protein [Streptomyces pathocidini]|uniref:DoxX family protein n=1 Tax=Streptomyces pathocidini TaxID=1650571 RepID=UPI0033E71030
MSVDTRTPRPSGGRSSGYHDDPALSTVKVPCDPAQVVVNHASFRVQLATTPPRGPAAPAGTAPLEGALATVARPRTAGALGPGSQEDSARYEGAGTRRAPVVWSGRTEPGDPAAGRLLQAVRNSGAGMETVGGANHDGVTQVLPRIRVDDAPTVIGPRAPQLDDTAVLRPVRPGGGPYEPYRPAEDGLGGPGTYGGRGAYDRHEPYEGGEFELDGFEDEAEGRSGSDSVRHAYYPGRRMNLGVVLLPLRVFLGFISIYAGMGKLCDPVYFDGGDRGSMVTWLHNLHPWQFASPLRDFALSHPVGAGLTVAFLQVLVGVLTIFGLWQRVAASVGALLSAALLVTVTWRSVPVYEAPDIIYLAAWSPLIIAGAPVYSLDARLAGEAWRRLGPRVSIWELRRRVLRRGTAMATVVVGLSLLIGSMLGGAVRSTDMTTVPGPTEAPRNHLPGKPLPRKSEAERASQGPTSEGSGSPEARRSEGPSEESGASTEPGVARETGTVGTGGQQPGQTPSGTGGSDQAPSQPEAPAPPASGTSGSSSSSGGGSSSPGGSGGGDGSGGSSGGSDGGSSTGGALGGLLG